MKHSKGFTLIELAIVVVIAGVLIVSLSNLLLNYMNQTRYTSTERKMEIIYEALQLHLSLRGRYPCVAEIDAGYDTPEFGVEVDCGDPASPPSTISSGGVMIGAVPTRTLNLPDDFIGDAWGGRFTYAVTESLADPDALFDPDNGAISVVDTDTPPNSVINPAGSAHYVIVSHGSNNSGARNLSGGGTTACTAGDDEEENCDNDDVFLSTLITSLGNNAYDDLVSISTPTSIGQAIPSNAIMAFDQDGCPDGWVPYAAAQDRFIIGAGTDHNRGDASDSDIGITVSSSNISPGGGAPVSVVSNVTLDNDLPPYLALTYCRKP